MENSDFRPATVNKPTKMKIYCPCCGQNNGQVRLNFSIRPTLILACKFCEREFSLGPVDPYNKLTAPMLMLFATDPNFQFHCPVDGSKNIENGKLRFNQPNGGYEEVKKCNDCKRIYQYRYFDAGNKEHSDYWEWWKNDQKKNSWNAPLDNRDMPT